MIRAKEIQIIPISEIQPNERNRNKHDRDQIEQLKKIIAHQGFRNPITISNRSGKMVAGHGRLIAAKELGYTELPAIFQDFASEEDEYAHGIADNAIALQAELDLSGIHTDLPQLDSFDISLLGIKDFQFEPDPDRGDEDAVPDVPKVAKTKRGELWVLGNHRLLCGDATSREDVERLMGGERADMVFTDPPYGVNAVHNRRVVSDAPIGFGKTTGQDFPGLVKARAYLPVTNDDKPFDPTFLIGLADSAVIFGGNYFHDKLPLGWRWIVWDKISLSMDSAWRPFGDCELAWTNLEGRAIKIYRHLWAGLCRAGNRNEEMAERIHPTQKPVGLCAEMLSDLSENESKVIDPFLGSGSTLIACEKTNRRCFGMEIEPLYCDVILDRFLSFSGKMPIREDGARWDEVKNEAGK